MKCNILNFNMKETVILLRAGHEGDRNYNLERRILSSIVSYINEFEPCSVDHLYGRAADILLFEDHSRLSQIKGIGSAAIKRIDSIRDYLKQRDMYRWIFTSTNKHNREDEEMLLFGDMQGDLRNKKMDKEYLISINGFPSSEGYSTKYEKREFVMNLTPEELRGIEKLFKAIETSQINYITGLGVTEYD